MKYRVLTVSGELGSGGIRIAKVVADRLGWRLLDEELIHSIARAAHVDTKVVAGYDERPDSWLRHFHEEAVRGVATLGNLPVCDEDFFDAREMADITQRIIEEAHQKGNCVIVGRGSQCLLHAKADTFHLFVYAPLKERIERLKTMLEPGANIPERIHLVEEQRAKFLRQHFGCGRMDPHLYDLMLRTHENLDAAADIVLYAMNEEH
jgi:cytidylate kinase